ncbi:hypothetical protein L345_07636, partial [Ophiophagus hannah]
MLRAIPFLAAIPSIIDFSTELACITWCCNQRCVQMVSESSVFRVKKFLFSRSTNIVIEDHQGKIIPFWSLVLLFQDRETLHLHTELDFHPSLAALLLT